MQKKIVIFLSLLILASMSLAACAQITPVTAQTTQGPTSVVSQPVTVAPTIIRPTTTTMPSATPLSFKPKEPTTYVVPSNIPDMFDPALCYSGEGIQIIQNTHDSLIFYDRENPNAFVPMLAVEVPSLENGGISADGLTYTFKIRPGVRFHDGSEMTPTDVAYTFQRGLLQGGSSSPQWLLTEPFLGIGLYDITDIITPSLAGPEITTLNDDPANLARVDPLILEATCKKVADAIVADDEAGTVTMKLAQPWGPFLATFTNSWGAITSKSWITSKGGWDGDCKTWQNYYGKTSEQLIEQGLASSENGTGPYKLEALTQGDELVLVANEDYWVKQPLWAGGPSGAPKIKKIIFKSVPTSEMMEANMLKNGEADENPFFMPIYFKLLDPLVGVECQETIDDCREVDPNKPLRVIKGLERVAQSVMSFNFNINTEGNELIGSGQLDGNGIPPNFFSDPLVRKGFAYCFNYETYVNEAFLGEATRSIHIMLPGMLGYNEDAPSFNYDPARCAELLQQSRWTHNPDGSWSPDPNGTVSLWDTGFRFKTPYVGGDPYYTPIAQIFQAELGAINNKFIVEATEMELETWYQYYTSKIPILEHRWIEDIHDPHNWVVPFTTGVYARRQNLPDDIQASYAEITNRAVSETDPEKRAEIYKEFNQLWYDTASSITLFVPKIRLYDQRWVRGRYYNPIYSRTYFYPLWKE
jgi:peptide/nickel transport system substrate-binding protein